MKSYAQVIKNAVPSTYLDLTECERIAKAVLAEAKRRKKRGRKKPVPWSEGTKYGMEDE